MVGIKKTLFLKNTRLVLGAYFIIGTEVNFNYANCALIGKNSCLETILYSTCLSHIKLFFSNLRYYIIKNQTKKKFILFTRMRNNILIAASCLLFSLFWSLAPFLNWSYYSLESALTTCSVEWKEKSFNVISYNIAVFIFVYFAPMIILISSNIKTVFMVMKILTAVFFCSLNFNLFLLGKKFE